nr:myelin transcription factor 1-like [Anser cygnoides]
MAPRGAATCLRSEAPADTAPPPEQPLGSTRPLPPFALLGKTLGQEPEEEKEEKEEEEEKEGEKEEEEEGKEEKKKEEDAWCWRWEEKRQTCYLAAKRGPSDSGSAPIHGSSQPGHLLCAPLAPGSVPAPTEAPQSPDPSQAARALLAALKGILSC